MTKLLANRRLPGEHSLHRRTTAARHAVISNREPDITEARRQHQILCRVLIHMIIHLYI